MLMLVKRRAFKLLLFLIAGAIINVAVAWGCLLLGKPLVAAAVIGAHHTDAAWHRDIKVFEKRGSVFALSNFWWHTESEPDVRTFTVGPPVRDLISRFSFRSERDLVGRDLTEIHVGAGWPCIALRGAIEYDDPSEPRARCGILLRDQWWVTGWRWGAPRFPKLLAYLPVWPGFAINTIFYAAVLWVLFAAPFKLLRWRRIKRGQCASCGYSLRGHDITSEKCPECGAETQMRATAGDRRESAVRDASTSQ